MMAHKTDELHLKLALPSLLILAGLTGYSILDLPYCFTPSEFTGAQVAYTRNACGRNMSQTAWDGWAFPRHLVNLLAEGVISVGIYLLCCHIASTSSNDSNILKFLWQKSEQEKLIQPITIYVKQLLSSSKVAVLYFLIQLLAISCWLLAFLLIHDVPEQVIPSHVQLNGMNQTVSDTFFCDFTVRRMGTVQRFTVQCDPPTYSSMKYAILGNKILCLLMAFTTMVHVAHTFLFVPMIQRRKAKLFVEAAGLGPANLGWDYGLTDFYMATALSPVGFGDKSDKDTENN